MFLAGSHNGARRLRMLVVDDDPAQEILIRAALGDHPDAIDIVFHTDAAQCLEALGKAAILPDILLVDVNMPRMSGPQFMQHLRAAPKTQSIPAVGWSSSDRREDINSMYQHGVSGYLVKPLTFEGLYDTVHIVLDYWHLATPAAQANPWAAKRAE